MKMGENIVYYVPSGPGEAEIEEKRSRFISYLSVSETEAQAKLDAGLYDGVTTAGAIS